MKNICALLAILVGVVITRPLWEQPVQGQLNPANIRVFQATASNLNNTPTQTTSTNLRDLIHGTGSGATLTAFPIRACDITNAVTVTAGTTAVIVPSSSGRVPYVCALSVSLSAAGSARWIRGTQTTNPCDTGAVNLTPAFTLATNTPWSLGDGIGTLFYTLAGEQICLAAVTGNAAVFIDYALGF